jgi:hypothetical protein
MRAYIARKMLWLAIDRRRRSRDPLDQAASIEVTPWLV